jgi:hypothetical protein
MRESKRPLFDTVMWSLTAVVVIVLGIVFLDSLRGRSGIATIQSQCRNNLKQIMIGLWSYHEEHGSFPPAFIADESGKPIHSWRVLLLPYLDANPLYEQYRFDEPWDGPNNSKLHAEIIELYQCPHDSFWGENQNTNYVAIVGKQTAWPGSKSASHADIKDGEENTIILVEVENSGIHWMEPRDLEFDTMSFQINDPTGNSIRGNHRFEKGKLFWKRKIPCVNAATCDGSARSLPHSIDETTLKALLTIDGKEPVSESWLKR